MKATSATAMVIFSKVLFRKLLDHSYVKVFYQQSFEGHPTVKELRTWIKIRANSSIKT